MKITCETCQSKYTVSDDKVQGKTVKIKCKKCGATIVVSAGGATTTGGAASMADAGASSAADSAAFLVNVGENDQRTMTLAEVVDAYNASVITADTYIWSDERNDWQALSEVEAIVAALNAGASAAEPAPEPAPAPRAAARRDPGRQSQDLFGGGFAKPAADDVAASAPLFSAAASSAAKPGQRDENSVLFSLSALTAKAGNVPSAPTSAASREDSGLIDLKALTASAPQAAASLAADPLDLSGGALFPLGAPEVHAPAAAPAMAAPAAAPAAPNRTGIFIGVGGIVAALAIVGTFMAMKGGDPPQPPVAPTSLAAVAPEPTIPAVEPTATPTASAAASAAPSAEASASASAAPAAPAKPTAAKNTGGAKAGTSTKTEPKTTTTPTPAAATPPKKSGGGCGCAPSDLMCNMRCSAGGK